MALLLAIDQSTSATKALLYNATGKLLGKEAVEHRQIYPQPGWVEHDAEEIWRNTIEAVRRLVEKVPEILSNDLANVRRPLTPALSPGGGEGEEGVARGLGDEIVCLSLTNQRETVVVFERGSGRPLRNAIVWQCRRGDAICRELKEAGHEGRVTQLTGLRLDTYFSASKLKWLVRQEPELAARLASGEALIGTMDAYLIYRLTGGRVFATDHTNACRTLLYDIGALGWDAWLCELFEVPMKALPEVRESSASFGETTCDGVFAQALPICGVMGDSQASLLAQRCLKPGMTKVTFGTGSSVLSNVGGKLQFSKSGAVTTIAWVYRGKVTYAFEGIINFSAATIAWLKDQLGLIASAREAGALAAAVPDNGGVYLVPAFAGLSAPHWNADARAAIVGLSGHSTRNHVVRAAEESMAYQLRDVMEMMKAAARVPWRRICADGGPTADAFLMAFTADMLGLELQAADATEGSALGAVMMGMLGRGLLRDLDAMEKLPREVKTYQPTMSAELVEKNYAGWKRAVKRVL